MLVIYIVVQHFVFRLYPVHSNLLILQNGTQEWLLSNSQIFYCLLPSPADLLLLLAIQAYITRRPGLRLWTGRIRKSEAAESLKKKT